MTAEGGHRIGVGLGALIRPSWMCYLSILRYLQQRFMQLPGGPDKLVQLVAAPLAHQSIAFQCYQDVGAAENPLDQVCILRWKGSRFGAVPAAGNA